MHWGSHWSLLTHLLCKVMAECVLQARSGNSVWGGRCHVRTSQWTSAGTARLAASVQKGLSNRWMGSLYTNVYRHIYGNHTPVVHYRLYPQDGLCVQESDCRCDVDGEQYKPGDVVPTNCNNWSVKLNGGFNTTSKCLCPSVYKKITLRFNLCVFSYLSTCEAGRLINCSQGSCNGRQRSLIQLLVLFSVYI